MGTLRALGILALLLPLWLPSVGFAGELSGEEKKWAKECLRRVSANSPRAREGAERALVALGVDVLPMLVEAWSRLDGRAERASLKRVFQGLGPERVVRALERLKGEARGREAKRIEEVLGALSGRPSSADVLRIPLEATTDLDPSVAPLGAIHEIGDTLPRALGLGMRRVRVASKGLVVDVDGDGTPEVDVPQRRPRVIVFRTGSRLRPVAIHPRLGTWHACSASVLEGKYKGRRVRILDANLDGAFGKPGDYVQVEDGGFVAVGPPSLLRWGDRLARYEVSVRDDGAQLLLTMLEDPPGLDAPTMGGFLALNLFRDRAGLPPLRYDEKRSKHCRAHAEYLGVNFGKRGITEGAAHRQDPNARGYTPGGAEAAANSNVGPGELPEVVVRIGATLLHRARWLCGPEETVGLGQTRKGGGWSVVWTGPGRAVGGTPVAVPGPGAKDVPLTVSAENPVPDANPSFYARPRGYPISMTYAPVPFEDVRLALLEGDGATPVAGRLFTPQKPVARSSPTNGGSAYFVPDQPLRSGRTYWALFTARRDGRPIRHAWSFRTR